MQNKPEEVDSTFSLREKRPKGVCNIFCGPIFAKLCAEKKSIFVKVSPKCSPWKAVLFRDEISDFYLGPLDKHFVCLGKLFSKVLPLQMVRKKKKDFDWYSNVFSISSQFKEKKGNPKKIIKVSRWFFSPQNTLKICWKAKQHKTQLLFDLFHRSQYWS